MNREVKSLGNGLSRDREKRVENMKAWGEEYLTARMFAVIENYYFINTICNIHNKMYML